MDAEIKIELMDMTTEIVAAYVTGNPLSPEDLPRLIENVHAALSSLTTNAPRVEQTELMPAVPIKKSVTSEFIICLEDGKKFKSLKRHLRTRYNMSPDEYRQKWGLPADYPMVAPNYAKARSELAKRMGLGTLRRSDSEAA